MPRVSYAWEKFSAVPIASAKMAIFLAEPHFRRRDRVIEVYDSLSRRLVEFKPRIPGHVSIYTCGVTPYDHSHLGHARPAVVWDVIRRHLRRRGYVVTYVQNYTDIDDKIIRRASEVNEPVDTLSSRYIAEYHAMLERLGVIPPDFAPRVTENIESIIGYIQALVEKQQAYEADGSVYFRAKGDPEYGRLSRRKVDEMLEGVRVELEPEKEYAGDFALWKRARPGEPAWSSPWGPGRPGWHIECSAMSLKYLGAEFDMHGGGMDLLFPHHENERAQSRAYLGHEPVSLWVHAGLVTRGSVKMSKSLKNGITLNELLSRFSGRVIRTYLLREHYRSPLDFDESQISEWAQALLRIDRLWEDVKSAPAAGELPAGDWAQPLATFEDRFLASMDDDFNTAQAFAEVFDMVRAANRGIDQNHADVARGLARRNLVQADEILGFLESKPESVGPDRKLAEELVQRRDRARRMHNFALADDLRDVLTAAGYEVLDGSDGTRIHYLGGGQ